MVKAYNLTSKKEEKVQKEKFKRLSCDQILEANVAEADEKND